MDCALAGAGYLGPANDMDTLLLISENAWLQHLPREVVARVAAKAIVRRLAHGELWVSRNERAPGIALIAAGALRSTTFTPDGKEYVFSILQKGEIWGLVSTLDGINNVNDVYAHGDTVLLSLDRRTTIESMETFPEFRWSLIRILCHRLRMANLVLEDRALAPLEVRLVRLLLSLRRAAAPGRETTRIDVTQEMLSKMLGCTRPTINKTLRALEAAALIAVSYGCVDLRDVDGLLRISGEGEYLYF